MDCKESKLCLGIDLGTTSVKTCLIDGDKMEVLHSISKPSHAEIPSDIGSKGSEQDPILILKTLKQCLETIPAPQKQLINTICITGQMHGVMLWSELAVKPNFTTQFENVGGDNCSNLYTWQDQRCSSEFLLSLPKPDSHLPLSTGYGCATILWLSKHRPEILCQFGNSGTVMDFLVAGLCGLDKPITSVQLAASWGYFNTREMSWNFSQLTECGLHIDLLPYVVCPGHKAGTLQQEWCGIKPGVTVLAALGDVQCAVYSVLKSQQDAVINISTSCQLAFPVRNEELLPLKADSMCPVQYFPYFEDSYLAIAASLNGGNVLANFVSMLRGWMKCFGCNIEDDKVWDTLMDLSINKLNSQTLKVTPTLFGERHDPQLSASVTGISAENLDLGTLFRSVCCGLLDNVSNMMPVSFLEKNGINKLIGSGSLLSRNEVMRQEIVKYYGKLTVEFGNSCDSATGAAMYSVRNSTEHK
ncbi:sedoheptulokinase-like [Mytilus californianus]|uniref:sedoheptulokinase-like n=1 Tax=Mytilus californianus TaxID=6549 RepID=UPI002246D9D9|nr:sedoheptulokinase-like [Mytilus californianus]